MQTMTAPFRFTAQWAMFPLLAALAVVLGASLGGLDVWLTTHPADGDRWIRQVVQSPLALIVVITLLGLVTNSWTIATLTGALALASNFFAGELAASRWEAGHYIALQDVILGCSLALIAGGGLGLAACVWHHEDNLTRVLGASGLGGALLWAGWGDLAAADWARDSDRFVAWISLVLAAVVVLRCRQPGFILLAAGGCAVVAGLTSLIDGGEHLQVRSLFHDLVHLYHEIVSRLRQAIRS